MKDGLLMVA